MSNILKAMGLKEGWKTLDAPVVVEDARGEEHEELSRDQANKFRSFAVLNLALGQPAVAVSSLCQKIVWPTAGSLLRLKRVARYLKKYLVLLY